MMDENGGETTDPAEIKEIVRKAWATLSLEEMGDDRFDRVFAQHLQDRLEYPRSNRREPNEEDLDRDISLAEVRWACARNKKGKAPGMDEIITEWMKYGGDSSGDP